MGLEAHFDWTNQRRSQTSNAEGVCASTLIKDCNIVIIRESICTPDIELLTISLRPYYVPWEFQQLFFTVVYNHPRANADAATQLIADVTHRLELIYREAPKCILGDFNHCQLHKTLKTYEQYVSCATARKNSMIDFVLWLKCFSCAGVQSRGQTRKA